MKVIQIGQTILLAILFTFITLLLIQFPDQALEASIRGLNIWWEIVFPSLLPFFIIAELLISFGIVTFLGILFEPIMRPLFNVPGAGSFAWVMGMASGYPSGAKICTRLREKKEVTQIEAERLLTFTNASSPLFIFGAIAVGFFNDPHLGLLIASCHYIGNTLVGFGMRFYHQSHTKSPTTNKQPMKWIKRIAYATKNMHKTRMKDPRPFGESLGDAILSSVKTLVMVGGYIIIFSVFTKLLELIDAATLMAYIYEYLLTLFQLPKDLGEPLFFGLFEITLGTQKIAEVEYSPLLAKIMIVSFILGFHGFSIQAQVASIIAKTDIRFTPYFIARFFHGLLASFLTVILYKPLYVNRKGFESQSIPAFGEEGTSFFMDMIFILKQYGPLLTIICLGLAVYILVMRQVRSAIKN